MEFENYIVGEQIIKIEHCILGVPGGRIEDIRTVYSHPPSLMQSARFLSEHDWKQISLPDVYKRQMMGGGVELVSRAALAIVAAELLSYEGV